jgi:hypothetical protein
VSAVTSSVSSDTLFSENHNKFIRRRNDANPLVNSFSHFNSLKMTKIPLNSSVFSSRRHFSKTNRLNQLISLLKHIYQIKFTFQHYSKKTKILKCSDRKFSFRSILIPTYPTTLIKDMSTKF